MVMKTKMNLSSTASSLITWSTQERIISRNRAALLAIHHNFSCRIFSLPSPEQILVRTQLQNSLSYAKDKGGNQNSDRELPLAADTLKRFEKKEKRNTNKSHFH